METRRIGSLQVTVVGLGCNNFGGRLDAGATAAVVHAALDAGINFLDTADIYGGTKSEEFMGRALRGRRGEVVLATKFGGKIDEQRQGAKPAYVRQALEDSLRRLETDHIDLYQLHMPDPETPIADTLGALNELVRAGKVREIGCSNFSVEQLRAAGYPPARSAGRVPAVPPSGARFVSVQNEYSLLHRDPERDGVLAECERLGLAFLPYFPLASGLLTGKYRQNRPAPEGSRLAGAGTSGKFLNERSMAVVEALIQFAESRGHTLLELAISWLLTRPAVASVIAGATKPEQVNANVTAAGWKLTADDLAQIDTILRPLDRSGAGEGPGR